VRWASALVRDATDHVSSSGVNAAPLLPPEPDRPDVGDFDQGTPGSRWALGRYLVGRAIGEYVGRALLAFALVVLAVAGLVYWAGPTWLAVLLGVFALCVWLVRQMLGALLRSVSGAAYFGPLEARMRELVADTRADVRAELRRIGLPSRTWTLPLLAARLAGRRRRGETLERLRRFDADRVVPRSRIDEMHLIVRQLRPR
jgi:hypothetical protein